MASILKVEVNVLGLLDAEDEGNTFLQNVDNPFITLESSATLLSDLIFYNILLIMF